MEEERKNFKNVPFAQFWDDRPKPKKKAEDDDVEQQEVWLLCNLVHFSSINKIIKKSNQKLIFQT